MWAIDAAKSCYLMFSIFWISKAMMPSALGTSQSVSMIEGLLTALSLNTSIRPDRAASHVNEDEKSEPNRFVFRESMKSNVDTLCKWMYAQIHQFRIDTMKSIDHLLEAHVQDALVLDQQRAFQRKLNDTKTKFKECLRVNISNPLGIVEVDGPTALSKESTDADRRYDGTVSLCDEEEVHEHFVTD